MNFFQKNIQPKKNLYKLIFIILSAIIFIIYPYLSFDFGITCDENIHNIHGRIVLEYFQGKNNKARLNPFTEDGKLISVTSDTENESVRGLNSTGGLFDLICNFIFYEINFTGEYETRHFINSIFGSLTILFIGLIAASISGWRAGVIALLFAATAPRLLGHSMNNPKDIPAAAFYIFSLYQIILLLKELPIFKTKRIIFLAMATGLSCAVRLSGLLTIPYLFFFLFLFWVINLYSRNSIHSEKPLIVFPKPLPVFFKSDFILGAKYFFYTVLISVFGYLSIAVLWPYVQLDPLKLPFKILLLQSNFDVFNSYGLFEGRWINNWEIPWYYIPKWILITFPIHILLGAVLLLFTLYIFLFKEKNYPKSLYYFVLIFAFAFPVFFVIWKKSNVYDDGRHLLFAFTPLISLSAISINAIIDFFSKKIFKKIMYFLLACMIAEPLWWMFRNHPNEVTYFNPLIGGIDGAFKKYDIDYWGNSERAAVEWIHQNVKPDSTGKPVVVTKWYGSSMCVQYYLEKVPGYKFAWANKFSNEWNYCVLLPAYWKFQQSLRDTWPPEGTVYQVMVDNTPVCAVIKNTIKNPLDAAMQRVKKEPSSASFINLGMEFYKQEKFTDAIHAFYNAIRYNPLDYIAYNNICACFNNLKEYDSARVACEKSLQLKPDFDRAINNLKLAKAQNGKNQN